MPKRKIAKPKKKAAKPAPPAKTGMWKILEFKTKERLAADKARADGHSHYGPEASFQPHARGPRFSKFAGPRRKVG